jgi:prepilin peptidase CpaA
MIAEALFTGGMIAAASCDLARRKVPNGLNVAILAAGLTARVVLGGSSGFLDGVEGTALGLALLFYPFQAGWMGGGDVKLAAAIGAWLGAKGVVWGTLVGLVGGGGWAAAIAATGGGALRAEVIENVKFTMYTLQAPSVPRRRDGQVVPLAVCLGAAAIGVMLWQGGFHA